MLAVWVATYNRRTHYVPLIAWHGITRGFSIALPPLSRSVGRVLCFGRPASGARRIRHIDADSFVPTL